MKHIYTNCSYNIYTPTKLKIYGSKVYTVEFLVSHPATLLAPHTGLSTSSWPGRFLGLAGPALRLLGRAGFKA